MKFTKEYLLVILGNGSASIYEMYDGGWTQLCNFPDSLLGVEIKRQVPSGEILTVLYGKDAKDFKNTKNIRDKE